VSNEFIFCYIIKVLEKVMFFMVITMQQLKTTPGRIFGKVNCMKLQNLTTLTTTLALAVLIACTNKSKPQTLPTETQPTPQDANLLKDPRDGKTYKIVKIGEQVWMLDNLNYDVEGSSTEFGAVAAVYWSSHCEVTNKNRLFSVRCIKDD